MTNAQSKGAHEQDQAKTGPTLFEDGEMLEKEDRAWSQPSLEYLKDFHFRKFKY